MGTRESERPPGANAARAHPRRPAAAAAPLIELLHPRGAGASLGSRDVVFLEPLRRPGHRAWAAAVDEAQGVLAPDGIVYALPGRRARGRVCRLLRRRGFTVLRLAHLPAAARPSYLVPVRRAPLAFALERLGTGAVLRRRVGRALLRVPGGERLVGMALADVGVAAVRPPARPAAWLRPDGGSCEAPLVGQSWRGAEEGRTVFCFAADGEPSVVAKVTTGGAAGEAGEADALARLAPVAARAGARVPSPISHARRGGLSIVVETAVAGTPAAAVLERRPRSLPDVLDALAAWLLAWNRLTARVEPLRAHELAEAVLAPASELAPGLPDGDAYSAWLSERCAELDGEPLARVSSHGDLTMRNVLLAGGGAIGIVDWEAADAGRFPLGDLAYAAVDAVDASTGYSSRARAFERCFGRGDELGVGARVTRLARALEVPPEATEICLHAAWLGHALDERRRLHGTAAPRPFLGLVELLAAGVARREPT
jgi:hypothetical protein